MKRAVAIRLARAALRVIAKAKRPSKNEWDRIYRQAAKKGGNKKWLCCSHPTLKAGAKGNKYWASMCTFKRGKDQFSVHRNIGNDPKKKPPRVVIDGKTVKWC